MKQVREYSVADVPFVSGALCLDFTNTVGWWRDPYGTDKLHNYADLLTWSERAGLLEHAQALRVRRSAARQPAAAGRIFHQALSLRDAIYYIFRALIRGESPKPEHSAILNETLARGSAHTALAIGPAGADWSVQGNELEQVLWAIARSAAELLTSEQLRRVKHCANEDCGWLFLDQSHSRSRRWCSMTDCGNRAKVNQFLARQRALHQ